MKQHENRDPVMSQKEIFRKYNKMMAMHAEPVKKNRVNCYTCVVCGLITKTIDIDNGTTPFITGCGYCGGDAYSSFYNDIVPNDKPIIEWYRPTLKETLRLANKHDKLEHILLGGLIPREIKNKFAK
jgi:hypothetical protein